MRNQNKSMFEVISRTVSIPLSPMRLLILELDKAMLDKINTEIQSGNWPVHNYHWKNWLGIFLLKLKSIPKLYLGEYPRILKHVIWLCKSVMKEEYLLFWEVVD